MRRYALGLTDTSYFAPDATPVLAENIVFNDLVFKMEGREEIQPFFAEFVKNTIVEVSCVHCVRDQCAAVSCGAVVGAAVVQRTCSTEVVGEAVASGTHRFSPRDVAIPSVIIAGMNG